MIDARARRRPGLSAADIAARRHHQPARDHGGVGQATPASRSTTRSSGRTRAPTSICDELAADGGQDRFRETRRAAARHLLLGPEDRAGSSTTSRARASGPRPATCCSAPSTPGCIWNLTGGRDGGVHVTDVTNAQPHAADGPRDARLGRRVLDAIGVPRAMLPEIRSSSEVVRRGRAGRLRRACPIAGDPRRPAGGDVRPGLLRGGEAKNTYGTGNFLLLNTGTRPSSPRTG